MKFSHLATAAAAVALMGGAAYAQQPAAQPQPDPSASTSATTSTDTAVNPPTAATTDATAATAAPAPTDAAPVASSATSYASGVSVTTTTLTNGPVPDTAENRAKYGKPMSNAGKRTAAKGN